jgi:hypothetical protein
MRLGIAPIPRSHTGTSKSLEATYLNWGQRGLSGAKKGP